MAKQIALHDKITIDGTAFSAGEVRSVETESENQEVDASGFSTSGNDEKLAGPRVQSITFEIFHTEETFALLKPIHFTRDVVPILWQPDGLIDAGRETLYGNAQLLTFNPGSNRGDVRTYTCRFTPGDSDGFDWYAAS